MAYVSKLQSDNYKALMEYQEEVVLACMAAGVPASFIELCMPHIERDFMRDVLLVTGGISFLGWVR